MTGATCMRPKPSVAFTRSRPLGRPLALVSNWLRSSISPRMRRACSRNTSPSGVSPIRRVVRVSSGMPMRASIWASRLLTAAVEIPRSRAAALRLPAVATAAKKPSSDGWMPLVALMALLMSG
ncbi:hypothetical protein D3C72_1611820 [compost metagenome]